MGHNSQGLSGQSNLHMAYLIAAGLSPNSGSMKGDSIEKDSEVSNMIANIGGIYNLYQPGMPMNIDNPSQAMWGE